MNPPRLAGLLIPLSIVFTPVSSSHAADAGGGSDGDAVAVVARLYRDFAWEAVVIEPYAPGLAQQPAPVLQRYFDDVMVERFVADRECVHKSGGICGLDHAPLWASQDPAAYDLRVKPTAEAGVVDVAYESPAPNAKAPVRLRYELVRTARGWRIADIVSHEGRVSLRRQLDPKATTEVPSAAR